MPATKGLDTRAFTMVVPIGAEGECTGCDHLIRFTPPGKDTWIVANIYTGRGKKRRWDRMETWHPNCYEQNGQPYGDAPVRRAQITSRTSW